ncbi:hypothetical protein PSHT_09692 [Puccinia striiformis]|uniref:Uncharacterized protein n=1 Tax=Puccinia striiformis TaxID=27350 RepID=A0A2S4VF24_9BASI|nr:hypothetical protein PSHT_09692 [Puccinia striiformis]
MLLTQIMIAFSVLHQHIDSGAVATFVPKAPPPVSEPTLALGDLSHQLINSPSKAGKSDLDPFSKLDDTKSFGGTGDNIIGPKEYSGPVREPYGYEKVKLEDFPVQENWMEKNNNVFLNGEWYSTPPKILISDSTPPKIIIDEHKSDNSFSFFDLVNNPGSLNVADVGAYELSKSDMATVKKIMEPHLKGKLILASNSEARDASNVMMENVVYLMFQRFIVGFPRMGIFLEKQNTKFWKTGDFKTCEPKTKCKGDH